MTDHRIVYAEGYQAVCACGHVLSIYGTTSTIAAELGRHIREYVPPPPIEVPRDPDYIGTGL